MNPSARRAASRSRALREAGRTATVVLAGVLALAAAPGCGGDDGGDDAAAGDLSAACDELESLVQLPPEERIVFDRIVGPAPRLADVLLRPWSVGDVATQLMVFLAPEHAADAATIAQELSTAVDVSEVIGVEEMGRGRELLVGDAGADPVPAALRVLAIGAAEVERSAQAAEADPRVARVVSEAEAGPYWARFASLAYAHVEAELDAVEAAAPEELAAELRRLRDLAAELTAAAGPDLGDWQVPADTVAVARDLVDVVLDECDIYVEDA